MSRKEKIVVKKTQVPIVINHREINQKNESDIGPSTSIRTGVTYVEKCHQEKTDLSVPQKNTILKTLHKLSDKHLREAYESLNQLSIGNNTVFNNRTAITTAINVPRNEKLYKNLIDINVREDEILRPNIKNINKRFVPGKRDPIPILEDYFDDDTEEQVDYANLFRKELKPVTIDDFPDYVSINLNDVRDTLDEIQDKYDKMINFQYE